MMTNKDLLKFNEHPVRMPNGEKARIISYRDPGIVDILFDRGKVLEAMDYGSFLKGVPEKYAKCVRKPHRKAGKCRIIRFPYKDIP